MAIPETEISLTPAQLARLRETINPLEDCDDYGVGLYTATKTFVQTC